MEGVVVEGGSVEVVGKQKEKSKEERKLLVEGIGRMWDLRGSSY